MNHRQSFAIGPRLFVPAKNKPGVWLEWYLSPNTPITLSGVWIMNDYGYLVQI